MSAFLKSPAALIWRAQIAAKAQYVVSKGMGGVSLTLISAQWSSPDDLIHQIKFYDYQGLTAELYGAVSSVFKS